MATMVVSDIRRIRKQSDGTDSDVIIPDTEDKEPLEKKDDASVPALQEGELIQLQDQMRKVPNIVNTLQR